MTKLATITLSALSLAITISPTRAEACGSCKTPQRSGPSVARSSDQLARDRYNAQLRYNDANRVSRLWHQGQAEFSRKYYAGVYGKVR